MGLSLSNVASLMMVKMAEVDTLAHNLANLNTPGFRALHLSLRSFGETLLWTVQDGNGRRPARLPVGVTVGQERLDLRPGSLYYTGRPLDVAIEGEGFFVVQTPQGIRYTRKGDFSLSAQGTLVTPEGYPVLGARDAPLTVQVGEGVAIIETGEVRVRGQVVGRLKVVRFADPSSLRPAGEGYYEGANAQPAASARLRPGYLEAANVRPITEMVRMLSALRSYEWAARSLQAFAETDQALREATRV